MKYKVITAEIHTRTALHVGSGAGNETTDALIRRDAAGNPIIPGTALAGVLRSTLTRLAPRLGSAPCLGLHDWDELSSERKKKPCGCAVCQLLGDLNPQDEDNVPTGEQAKATASRLLVFNATLKKKKTSASHIRDGVGIDRATGAAARAGRVKFDLESLPEGQVFDLRLELRGTCANDEELLAAGLAEWQAGRGWVGGRVNRGMGAFKLKELVFKALDLDAPKNLVAFLENDKPWKTLAKSAKGENWPADQAKTISIRPLSGNGDLSPHIAQTWVKISGTLQAAGPLLTNDTVSSTLTGFDHAPLLSWWGNWTTPVLSGAGLRGVIRSHAERIARTIATHHAIAEKIDFLQICPACNPVESRKEAPLANCDSLLKKNGVSNNAEVTDQQLCLACLLFGSTRRGSRLVVEDAPYEADIAGEKPKLKMLDFLAIDRFTGGGADKFKFDALALWQPAFTLNLYLENPQPWELGWLALVLRDMQAGWLNVGMGAAKGFGRVELQNLKFTLGYLHADDLAVFRLDADRQREGLYTEKSFSLPEATGWVMQFNEKITGNEEEGVAGFSRGDEEDLLPRLPADTYFDGTVDKLYPNKVTI